jgi:hypothetical protein
MLRRSRPLGEEETMGEGLVQEALEALMPLEFYAVTPEDFEKWRLRALDEVAGLCGDEEAIAAANFGEADGGGRRWSWQRPKSLMLAVTAKRLYLFDASYRYSILPRRRKTGRPVEVSAWDRSAVRVEVAKPKPKTTLRIEPLDGGAVVRLAGPSTADDPWSLAVMALLDPSPTSDRVR